MRIAKLKVRNFLGVELLELDTLGKLVQVTGPNGAGKSTVLKAVQVLFGGSRKQPGLLREGAEEGEVWAALDDGTEITRRITAEGARESTVRDGRFKQPVKQPEAYLRKLVDALALDPVAFVGAEPRRKVQVLLETFPVAATPEEVNEALGGVVPYQVRASWPLPDLDALLLQVRETRTASNGARTKAAKTVEQMRETLQSEEEPGKDWAAEVKRLRGMQAAADEDLREQLEESRTLEDKVRREVEARRDKEREAVRAKYELELAEVADMARKTRDGIQEGCRPTLEGLAAKIAKAEERDKASAGARKARELVDKLAGDAEALTKEWQALDGAHERLQALKVSLCERLPLEGVLVDEEGLTVRDGHGQMVRFESLNTAEQVKFAVRLALQRAGELRAICCDGLERLDPEARRAFLEEAERSGAQFLVAYATEGEGLHVEGGEQ